jgi:hypothetical protein
MPIFKSIGQSGQPEKSSAAATIFAPIADQAIEPWPLRLRADRGAGLDTQKAIKRELKPLRWNGVLLCHDAGRYDALRNSC